MLKYVLIKFTEDGYIELEWSHGTKELKQECKRLNMLNDGFDYEVYKIEDFKRYKLQQLK